MQAHLAWLVLLLCSAAAADSHLSYHKLQMGFLHTRITDHQLDDDLRSEGIHIAYLRPYQNDYYLYANLNASTLDTGLEQDAIQLHFTGTLVNAAAGMGRHWALQENTDLYAQAGIAHADYALRQEITDPDTGDSAVNSNADTETGLHLEIGMRHWLPEAQLEVAPLLGLTVLPGDTDRYAGLRLNWQFAPQVQLFSQYVRAMDEQFNSFALGIGVIL